MNDAIVKEVAELLDMVSQEAQYAYHKATSQFICIMPELMTEEEAEHLDEHWFEYIPLPTQHEINEYRIMSEFAEQYPAAHIRDVLCNALHGRGAFRRFKDTCIRFGVEQSWYQFRRENLYTLAKEWCLGNGLL